MGRKSRDIKPINVYTRNAKTLSEFILPEANIPYEERVGGEQNKAEFEFIDIGDGYVKRIKIEDDNSNKG